MSDSLRVGGKSYRWRGKNIRSIYKNGYTYVSMPRKDSMVMIPVSLSASTPYKVMVTASKSSGNGALLVNFFGGKKYDGRSVPVNVTSKIDAEFVVMVTTPASKGKVPLYLKIWKPDNSSGMVMI